uniref:Transmembrane protein 18 n=1 Tax=Corethrella appendiculata TaxID=1370023 RepID=U5EGA6_9DIPT
MVNPNLIEINEITGIYTFLQSIDWYDPWLIGLISFHIIITSTALLTRNYSNFQVFLFFILLLLVYFSESINEYAAINWRMFSKQQYFDSKGLFISVVFCVPILLNCMLMVGSWLYQSTQIMTKLKTAQLQQQIKINKSCSKECVKEE